MHPGGREEQAEGADVRKNSEGRVLPPTLGRRRDVGDPPPMRGSDRPLKISTSTISHAFILWKNPRAHIGHCKQLKPDAEASMENGETAGKRPLIVPPAL